MPVSMNLVVAACTNRGIGINGRLPWKLGADMMFFKKITSQTRDLTRKNAVLMGRKTWDSIPAKFRPLANRINIIVSSTLETSSENSDIHVVRSFEAAVRLLSSSSLKDILERVFVIGGESIYKSALESGLCDQIYLTQVLHEFECDTFLPDINKMYQLVKDPDVDDEIQTDSVSQQQFKFTVYKRRLPSVCDSQLLADSANLPPVPPNMR